jgi:serine/threonine protein kinase
VYVALQFVDGSLKDVMRQRFASRTRKPFSRDEIADLLAPIASALDNLHRRRMVHLDIKPENILVFKGTNRAVLADLGIAQQQGTKTRAGTPLYTSPEQAAGDRLIGPWCDVYSLGVLVYEMLTGRPPFQSNVDMALLRLHLEEKPPPLKKYRRDISTDLERTVMRALSKDPAQRFPSATAFIEAVRRRETPISDAVRRTTMILMRTPQMVKRQPWVLGLVALVVAVPVMAALVSGVMRPKPTPIPITLTAPVITVTTVPPALATAPTEAPPVVTSTPRHTPTSAPTSPPRTPTPTRVATSSTLIYPAPTLMSPRNGEIVRAQGVDLVWAWNGTLRSGERFRVRITWQGGATEKLAEGTFLSTGQPPGGVGSCQWTVDVVRVDSSGRVIQVLSGPSDSWQIKWQ